MFKLMKYELRKTMVSKIMILALIVIIEGTFLIFAPGSEPGKLNRYAGQALGFLSLLSVGTLFFVAFECIHKYSSDLKDKCSYMLFMTPNSSYTIIGAKVLYTVVQFVLFGALYIGIWVYNIQYLFRHFGVEEEFLDMIKDVLKVNVDGTDGVLSVINLIISWMIIVIFAFLAITLSRTFLAEQKGRGFVSVVLFFVITRLVSFISNILTSGADTFRTVFLISTIIYLVAGTVAYLATSWMLDKKVSL